MDELKKIKKIYGEEMMHLCRELFPSLLEKPGLLLSTLKDHIAPNRTLAHDLKERHAQDDFKNFIYSFIDVENDNKKVTKKTPFELMDEAGYTLYECKSEKDIQSFRKYYAPKEVLCTIYNGGRLDRCHVFFAVKKNVDEIKRENFKTPRRQDEYGTSVISIQFSRGNNNTLSIKNRYNHSVNNPDSTFSNNLDNIIPGLTESFERYYKLHINYSNNANEIMDLFYDLGYVLAENKLYHYNTECDGIYYCDNNIIIKDGIVISEYALHPERYLLIDNYIVDVKEKTIIKYNSYGGISIEDLPDIDNFDNQYINDSFLRSIKDVGNIHRIYINKNEKGKTITIICDNNKEIKIDVDKRNNITGYTNEYVETIYDKFLILNEKMSDINLPNVKIIGDDFLEWNNVMKSISLPNVIGIGKNFLSGNEILDSVNLPNVKNIKKGFLYVNVMLKEISLPNVVNIGNSFMTYNSSIEKVDLPNVEVIGNDFLDYANEIKEIYLPKVTTIWDSFMKYTEYIEKVDLPNLERIGNMFLIENKALKEIYLPKVESIGSAFIADNKILSKVDFPKLITVGNNFLNANRELTELYLPNLKKAGEYFLSFNKKLKELSIPRIEIIPAYFMVDNEDLERLYLPNAKKIKVGFLVSNKRFREYTEDELLASNLLKGVSNEEINNQKSR